LGGEKLNPFKPYMGVFFTGFLIFSCLFGFISPLAAQTQEPAPVTIAPAVDESAIILGEPAVASTQSSGSSIFIVLRMVLVLALAALAIYGVVFFIKRLARPQESRDPYLKVLARAPLSSDTFAAVLSVGHKAWLVAGGSGGVNLISEIEEGESLETMLLDEERKMAEAGNRPRLDFRSLISKLGTPNRQGRDLVSHAERLRKQRERLKGP